MGISLIAYRFSRNLIVGEGRVAGQLPTTAQAGRQLCERQLGLQRWFCASRNFAVSLAWDFIFTCLQAHGWKVNSRQGAVPPVASLPTLRPCRKLVVIQDGANVFGRRLRKRVSLEQRKHLRRTLQQPKQKLAEPRRLAIGAQRREPHLPIQARLKGRNPAWGAVRITYLVFEFVSKP